VLAFAESIAAESRAMMYGVLEVPVAGAEAEGVTGVEPLASLMVEVSTGTVEFLVGAAVKAAGTSTTDVEALTSLIDTGASDLVATGMIENSGFAGGVGVGVAVAFVYVEGTWTGSLTGVGAGAGVDAAGVDAGFAP